MNGLTYYTATDQYLDSMATETIIVMITIFKDEGDVDDTVEVDMPRGVEWMEYDLKEAIRDQGLVEGKYRNDFEIISYK